eukprot:10661165-Ditylum_brightwellii.AAC.1
MKERGESYVEDESVMKTLVEVQWVLKLGSTMFNVHAALLEMGETKEVVQDPADLPTTKEFTEAFKVIQKEERNRPT